MLLLKLKYVKFFYDIEWNSKKLLFSNMFPSVYLLCHVQDEEDEANQANLIAAILLFYKPKDNIYNENRWI